MEISSTMSDQPPSYQDATVESSAGPHYKPHIQDLQGAIRDYRPGETIRITRNRPKNPPKETRIGLFGGPGVGKSALINSFMYITGNLWRHEAPEAYQTEKSMTMKRAAYGITNYLTVCDNRGMSDFSGKYMTEVTEQLGGVRRDDSEVVWDRAFFQRLTSRLKQAWAANEMFKIHCAVIVLSGQLIMMRPSDMKDLVETIAQITGKHPIVVITHKKSVCKASDLDEFKSGLRDLDIEYVHEIENYTYGDHLYDAVKHVELLELLNQCTMVADKVMKHTEEQGKCTLL